MGIKQRQINTMIDKALDKKDGVYSYKDILYKVKNNNVTHVAQYDTIYLCSGNFISPLGKCEPSQLKNRLKEM